MMRIMLVDDEESTREIVCRYLDANLEYRVVAQAGNGVEALEKIGTARPDVLITDICMPKMDGLELVRQIRQQELPTRVIIMSGYNDFEYAKRAIRYDVEDYLLKPFMPSTLDELLESIGKKLELSRYGNSDSTATRENFLNALVKGELEPEAIHKGAEALRLPVGGNVLSVGALRFFSADRPTGPQGTWERFCKLVAEQIPPSLHAVCFIQMPERPTILLFYQGCLWSECERLLESFFRSLSSQLESSCGRSVWCGFSPPFGSLCQAADANARALAVWKRTCSLDDRATFDRPVEKRGTERAQIERSIEELEDSCALALSVGDRAATGALDSLFGMLEQLALHDYHLMQVRLLSSVVRISNLVNTDAMNRKTVGEFNRYLNDAKAIGSLFETRYLLKKAVATALEAKRSENRPVSDIIISSVKEKIRQNLANESFTVDDAVSGFNYSNNYIRHIFSQREGISIKEYIIRQRMEMAKRLLGNSAIPIKEIAQRTGYRDQRYFSFGFKEFCGVSPTVWRKQHGNP